MQNAKQIIVFMIDNVQYGFLIEQVDEVIRYIVPTKVPNVSEYIEGIISLREKVNTIVDLARVLGIHKIKADANTKIIIGNGNNIGFIVDDVNMIATVNKEVFFDEDYLPEFIDKSYVKHIMKTDEDIIIILDMISILNLIKGGKEVV